MRGLCNNLKRHLKLPLVVSIMVICIGIAGLGLAFEGDVPTCSGAPPGPWHTYLCKCEASTWYGRKDEIVQGYSAENNPSAWATFQYNNWWTTPTIRSENGSLEEHLKVYSWPELQFQVNDYTCYWSPLSPE